MEILEISAQPIKTRQTNLCVETGYGLVYPPVAFYHDFTTITPTTSSNSIADGVVIDSTSMQYQNVMQTLTTSEYYRTRVVPGSANAPQPFGSRFRRFNQQSHSGVQTDQRAQILEAGLRTINDVVYRYIEKLGGLDRFLAMPHATFVRARHRLGGRVCQELRCLRSRLDQIYSSSWNVSKDLGRILRGCGGEGHWVMLRALYERG